MTTLIGKPILYSYWRSSCSWRVRIALNLKDIAYDIKPVSLIKTGGEQHLNEYREINPMEQVPALHIDGAILLESLSILQYLEETRPQKPLLPADCLRRAKVREICEIIASGIQPLQNLTVLIYVGEERKNDWVKHWINRGFKAVEKLLSSSAGKYSVGDEVTLADCCLIPQVFNARRFHVDLRPYPTILRIDRELENHPAFIAAHPSQQPDCPPEATNPPGGMIYDMMVILYAVIVHCSDKEYVSLICVSRKRHPHLKGLDILYHNGRILYFFNKNYLK